MILRKSLLAVCSTLIILVLTVTSVSAQGGYPPRPAHPDPQPSHIPPGANVPLSAASVPLGQPGLSFRYLRDFGELEIPYFADAVHINRPSGLYMDSSGALFVAEEQGNRILKYSASGAFELALGKAGVCDTGAGYLCNPSDIATDASGNIWEVDNGTVLVKYSSSGDRLLSYPAADNSPWQSGSGNDRFANATGVAIDSTGRIFVADGGNQRIQIFNVSDGAPVWNATIGVTGVSGDDNSHFNTPYRLAVDSADRLFIVDRGNARVQRCVESAGSWNCDNLVSGLNEPQGIAVDKSDNILVADTQNGRILRCSSGGTCATFADGLYWPYDVAVDASGNVYHSAAYECVVYKLGPDGSWQGIYLGVYGTPYLTDGSHFNHPRIAVDGSDNLIIIEENGQRLLKLDRTGKLLWAVGTPGFDSYDDNQHFNWPHGVAVDKSGKIYVADGSRIQIFSASGQFLSSFGTYGTANDQFRWVAGIAVDAGGNIYASDANDQRVKIFNSAHQFVAAIGVSRVQGSDNAHLSWPMGVEVDSSGAIYVADAGNCRVQKFNSSRQYQLTLGSGNCGEDTFDLQAEDVTVDGQGRVYVAGWNNTVKVFDKTGAFLTTIGGMWGKGDGQFKGVSGVALDSAGNVYATDWNNPRIEKFAPGYPNWKQINLNGFGEKNNSFIFALGTYQNVLYAGTANLSGAGSQVWKLDATQGWQLVNGDGFGDITNIAVDHLLEFNGKLYASTENCTNMTCAGTNGGQLWRYDGTSWEPITQNAFGHPTMGEIFHLSILNNQLCASTWDYASTSTGAQIWCSASGNVNTWTQLGEDGLGDAHNYGITSILPFKNSLFAGTANGTGSQVLKQTGAGTWVQVNTSGFGDPTSRNVHAMEVFKDHLYAITNTSSGAKVYRCSACDNTDWQEVQSAPMLDPATRWEQSLKAFNGKLYAFIGSEEHGMAIWQTDDGQQWTQVASGGLGTINNNSTYWGNAVVSYNNHLVVGTNNWANGGQIWQMTYSLFLPMARR